ncbi:GNAT family N-acetyltransferase [Oceanobacillus sp. FSL W8-0428]|uniref:GNAT family N-acetyltransferase n=1 Tax=Oceanobacillus sp. FSL W8-0428 TaxID=2921715 RepID=UPI0030FAF2EC
MNDFIKRSIGYAILHEGKAASAATPLSINDDDIEIATHPQYRKKGLATIAASELDLIMNKYPSQDRSNRESLEPAKKLGYKFKNKIFSDQDVS